MLRDTRTLWRAKGEEAAQCRQPARGVGRCVCRARPLGGLRAVARRALGPHGDAQRIDQSVGGSHDNGERDGARVVLLVAPCGEWSARRIPCCRAPVKVQAVTLVRELRLPIWRAQGSVCFVAARRRRGVATAAGMREASSGAAQRAADGRACRNSAQGHRCVRAAVPCTPRDRCALWRRDGVATASAMASRRRLAASQRQLEFVECVRRRAAAQRAADRRACRTSAQGHQGWERSLDSAGWPEESWPPEAAYLRGQ